MEQTTAVMKSIARIHSDFPSKFGIPRQSGLVEELQALVVMEPEFRVAEAFRGLEGFSHIWLIWQFSGALRNTWSPTVRPPRLGGNQRVGVFASRSPFRPNSMGLSCVRFLGVEYREDLGPVLRVAGADLMDGTPIFDIKPYVPLADFPTGSVLTISGWRWRNDGRKRYHRKNWMPFWECWGRIPGLLTRKIRNGYTAWNLPGWKSNFG